MQQEQYRKPTYFCLYCTLCETLLYCNALCCALLDLSLILLSILLSAPTEVHSYSLRYCEYELLWKDLKMWPGEVECLDCLGANGEHRLHEQDESVAGDTAEV